jgi:hypothetical protein
MDIKVCHIAAHIGNTATGVHALEALKEAPNFILVCYSSSKQNKTVTNQLNIVSK